MTLPTPQLGFLAVAAVLATVSPAAWSQDYHVRHYTLDDGLPSAHVRDITQDALGRMWFATRQGIASYDGSEWSVFNLADGLTWTDTFALRWDGEGVLWSVTSASPFRVFYFRGGRWNRFSEPAGIDEARIHAFAVAGSPDAPRVAIGTDRGLLVADGERWSRWSYEQGLPSNEVMGLAALDGRWVIATSGGLAELRDGKIDRTFGDSVPAGLHDVTGLTVEETASGPRLWVLGSDWIARVEEDRFDLVRRDLPGPLHSNSTPSLAVADRRQGLYLGGRESFFHLGPGREIRRIGRENGLLSDGLTAVFLDREDNLWVGSRRGLSKISDRRFMTYNRRHGLLDDEVTAILERRGGGIVLAHPGGLSWLEGREVFTLDLQRRLPVLAERRDRVRDLAEDEQGNLWVPTFGLVKVDASSGRLTHYSEAEGLAGAVDAVLLAHGRLWAAASGGLFVMRGERFERASTDAPRIRIRRLFEGSDGEILLASSSGLYGFSDRGWRLWTCRDVGPCDSVFAVHPRSAGDGLWVGTTAGLYRTRDELLVQEAAPTIRRPIYFIVEDAARRFWFGIDDGVLRWDGEKLEQFTVRHGLAGRETYRAAGHLDRAGRVWIGTERGVTVYTDDPRAPGRARPNVVLTGLEAAAERFPLGEDHTIPFAANDLVFRFSAVSMVNEEHLKVSWFLEGFDDGWRTPETFHRQEIRYTNLDPGRYRLHLKAITADGLESEVASSARLVVARPFWQQAWFFLAVGALFAGALYFLQSFFAHRRYSRRLEKEVAQRVAQLRKFEAELAKSQKLEAIGVLAGGIAHDFNNFLTVLNGNLSLLALPGRSERERAEDVKDAQAAVLRASKLTQQLLTFSRGGAPVRKAASISEVISESASFVLSGSKTRCAIELPEDLHVVEIDAGQIHQLFNNLLINAMQAMPEGGTVRIAGRNVDAEHPDLLKITASGEVPSGPFVAIDVADEGLGMTSEVQARIFDPYFTTKDEGRGLGLASSYSIARRHGGLLTVESAPGRGSTFTLFLPASEASIPETSSVDAEPASGSGRVLIMDDEESVRRVTGEICQDLGYEPAYAADGDEAVILYGAAVVEARPFDVVIMDLTIPGGMGGKETLRRLRDIDPSIKAIVISGYSNDPVMASYRDHGFQGRLAKPFRTHDLAQVLREVVGQEGRVESYS